LWNQPKIYYGMLSIPHRYHPEAMFVLPVYTSIKTHFIQISNGSAKNV
jgi:hypothetical protein